LSDNRERSTAALAAEEIRPNRILQPRSVGDRIAVVVPGVVLRDPAKASGLFPLNRYWPSFRLNSQICCRGLRNGSEADGNRTQIAHREPPIR